MTMTKTLVCTWLPPEDFVASYRADAERLCKLMEMEMDGKTVNHRKVLHIKKQTLRRWWRDQDAVNEWIDFMHYLAKKYNGKVIVGECADI